ncbi:hypothetical protein ABZS61_17055 [Streptomyces sp. NPDC005566]
MRKLISTDQKREVPLPHPDGTHDRIPEPWHAVPFQATRRLWAAARATR